MNEVEAAARLAAQGGCLCMWDFNDEGEDVVVEPNDECPLHSLLAENARLRALVERAVHPIMLALNCPAHSWHGSDEARRWLIDAAALSDQTEETA